MYEGTLYLTPIDAFEVVCCDSLAGAKHAVQVGNGPVYVSPAMWALISNANPEELQFLLKHIKIRQLPSLNVAAGG